MARNPLPVSSVRGSAAGAGPPPLARGRQPGHAVAVSSARGGVAQRACLRHPDTIWAPPCEKGHGGEAQCLPSSPGLALSGTPWGLRAQTQPIGLPWRNAPGGSSPGAHPGKPSPPPPPRVGPAAASRARLAARWRHTGLSAAAAVLLEAKQLGLPPPAGLSHGVAPCERLDGAGDGGMGRRGRSSAQRPRPRYEPPPSGSTKGRGCSAGAERPRAPGEGGAIQISRRADWLPPAPAALVVRKRQHIISRN